MAPRLSILWLLMWAPLGVSAQETAPTDTAPSAAQEAATPVRVAVVVIGDDPAVLQAGERVDHVLRTSPELAPPEDPAMRRALRGEPAEGDDDGLAPLRRQRAALGRGERLDAPTLGALGSIADAALLMVVRAGDDGPQVVGFDVAEMSFYEGALDPSSAPPPAMVRFIGRRAAVARAAVRHAEAANQARYQSDTRGQNSGRSPEPGGNRATEPDPTEEEEQGSWLDGTWPAIVAGVLLAAVMVYVMIPDSPAEVGPPVLRFIPGGR